MACEQTRRFAIGCVTAITIVMIIIGGMVLGSIFTPVKTPRTALQECAKESYRMGSTFCVELARKATPEDLKASAP